jgi:hypothetical protein
MPSLSLLTPPNVFLTVGLISISGAAFFAYTGKVWVRFSGWVYRETKPRVFWGEVAAYFLVGVFFCWILLVQGNLNTFAPKWWCSGGNNKAPKP